MIPKKPGAITPVDLWPITVGSVFLRLFHGLLGDRMERLLPISERQKGFWKGDGLFFNSTLLQRCVNDAKERTRNCRVAFLDMRKAVLGMVPFGSCVGGWECLST